MALRYRAFLFGPTVFDTDGVGDTLCAGPNVDAMLRFLTDSQRGVCRPSDVTIRRNEAGVMVKEEIARWFAEAVENDVLVFYLTTHGVRRSNHRTVFLMSDSGTRTSARITADDIRDWLGDARRARVVYFIVDACRADAGGLTTLAVDNVYWLLSSDFVPSSDGSTAQPTSPFTANLLRVLSADDPPKYSRQLVALLSPCLPDQAPVIRPPAQLDLLDVPLRRPLGRPLAASGRHPSGGGGLGAVLGWGLVVAIAWAALRGPSGGGGDSVSDEPETTAVGTLTTAPRVEPLTMAEADLGLARPIASLPCDGEWIVQIAAFDASSRSTAGFGVSAFLEVPGSSYTYTPLSCGSFDRVTPRYVIYLGPYSSRLAAADACEVYAAECFPRQTVN